MFKESTSGSCHCFVFPFFLFFINDFQTQCSRPKWRPPPVFICRPANGFHWSLTLRRVITALRSVVKANNAYYLRINNLTRLGQFWFLLTNSMSARCEQLITTFFFSKNYVHELKCPMHSRMCASRVPYMPICTLSRVYMLCFCRHVLFTRVLQSMYIRLLCVLPE